MRGVCHPRFTLGGTTFAPRRSHRTPKSPLIYSHLVGSFSCRCLTKGRGTLSSILREVETGSLSAADAEGMLQGLLSNKPSPSSTSQPKAGRSPDETLETFANLDHGRANRTGFPEAVFADGKTPQQVASILDEMAAQLNDLVRKSGTTIPDQAGCAILATRADAELYNKVSAIPLMNGTITYHEIARIISMRASALDDSGAENVGGADASDASPSVGGKVRKTVVVACAGTTDLPVAEEAAVTLEAAGCNVDRVYDVGVAGLHRIINALPRLRHPDVGCVIVCAGMDGALPSVVGGLVSVPVVAVPTSVGYGVSLGGVSAMLTMLNSCSPGVGVVNVDNGFGAAALAFKCFNN